MRSLLRFIVARKQKYDWSLHGDEITSLYKDGFSSRDIAQKLKEKHGAIYSDGALRHFIGSVGISRSKSESHKLALAKSEIICEICGKKHMPGNWNQRWCDECTGNDRFTHRIRQHGLPAIIIERLFDEQRSECAICGKKFDFLFVDGNKRTLVVDHDHVTNQLRGLLCIRCNSGLSFVDDEQWLKNAQRYIKDCHEVKQPIYVKPPRMRKYVRHSPVSI